MSAPTTDNPLAALFEAMAAAPDAVDKLTDALYDLVFQWESPEDMAAHFGWSVESAAVLADAAATIFALPEVDARNRAQEEERLRRLVETPVKRSCLREEIADLRAWAVESDDAAMVARLDALRDGIPEVADES